MAGPQVQHTQRPNSAYYTGLNGSGGSNGASGGGGGAAAGAGGMASSASHTGLGLHALRQVSNETELIYRGSHTNGTVNELTGGRQLTGSNSRIIQQQPAHSSRDNIVSSIAGTGSCATDALIGTISTSAGAGGGSGGAGPTSAAGAGSSNASALKKSNTQRSIEIIVDASQCGKDAVADLDDVEQGEGGGQESSSSVRKSSRHRHRPLHRRLISYLRNLFQGSAAQNALTELLLALGCISKHSELEEFETPARYRPDSLSALSRATRFTEDEIKRIYRGFKAECPTGVVKEDTFKVIYSQFFPQGGSCANPTLYAHYVFNTLDQDHSGIVSFEDFVQGLSILSRGSVEEKLRWTFSLYDINGDGFITREEMTDIVTAIYELMGRLPDECPEEEKIKGKVEQIFQKMDINRDGVVTLEEFLEACRNDDAISRSMSVFDTAF
ncbi:class E basic helix-loop-helix protein 22 isoform X1 [Drosophila nasuta]|uniref:class E basic helix-loop-helix protein 22 isoform X1 n=1 Tax=Drosophila nasuta TaxID=42062 RepID=UPI00295ED174|nr:class E basic helix-loop-helix protein 22 isoform X1 [Drosophila nasuta]